MHAGEHAGGGDCCPIHAAAGAGPKGASRC
jgi:hypothetical protein